MNTSRRVIGNTAEGGQGWRICCGVMNFFDDLNPSSTIYLLAFAALFVVLYPSYLDFSLH